MHKTSPAINEVMRSYVFVIVRATEVVLLLKSGRNEVCPATNYGRPKTSFPPNFPNKTTSVAQESHMPLPYYLIWRYIMHKTSPAINEVMRSYVSVIMRAATEVVLLLESGRNEVCPATNYGRPKTSFLPDFPNKTTSAGRDEVGRKLK
jgi:hypothetical protein